MKQFFVFALMLVFCSCNQKNEQQLSGNVADKKTVRYGMVTGIKPDKIDYYKKLHAKPWPAVLNKIEECNIRNYSIYLQKINDGYFLFSYFEYVGNNLDKDMQKMAADTTTQRWWKETDPCQLPLPEALEQHKIWTAMPEVFHAD
jgi:L-rhamnose mutarotase